MRFLADVSDPHLSRQSSPGMPSHPLNLLAGLPEQSRNAVRQRVSCERSIPAGQDIINQGETSHNLYNIVEGWVMLYTLMEDGRRQILQFCPPGSMIGASVAGTTATYGAQTMTPVTVSSISCDDLDRLMTGHPLLAIHLLRQLARDRELAFGRLASIGRQSARERVARLLLELYVGTASWKNRRQPEPMHLPLTQEHIGDATGLTGVHVNRVLRELKDDGILSFHYRKLLVMDLDAFVEAADMELGQLDAWTREPASLPVTWQGKPEVAVIPAYIAARAASRKDRTERRS